MAEYVCQRRTYIFQHWTLVTFIRYSPSSAFLDMAYILCEFFNCYILCGYPQHNPVHIHSIIKLKRLTTELGERKRARQSENMLNISNNEQNCERNRKSETAIVACELNFTLECFNKCAFECAHIDSY